MNLYLDNITYCTASAPSCTDVAAPTSLTCSEETKSSLTYTWTKAANASGYTATLYSDSECESQVAQQELGDVATVTFATLSGSTTYYCKVQSNGDGETYCAEGGETTAVSGTTKGKDYTVTAASNNATWGTAAAAASSLDKDETTTVTATPETGYKFVNWAVSGEGASLSSTTTNPTTLTMGTANATVTATFAALETYSVSHSLTNVTATSGATGASAATEGSDYTAVFAAQTGYDLPDAITVTIGGAAKTVDTDYTWNQSTGTVTIPGEKVTGAIVITVTGTEHVAPLSGTIFSLSMNTVSTQKSLAANENVDMADYATITGGSATLTNTGSDKGIIENATPGRIYFNGNAAYLILNLDDALKTGDKITITNITSVEMAFTTTATLDATYKTATTSGTGTFTVPEALNDVSTLYCWRATGSGLKVTAINITRYKITYDANGGTGTMEPTSNVVAANSFTAPDGETFTGWNTSADGSGTAYSTGGVVSADVTLYAQWGTSSAPTSVTVTPADPTVYKNKSVTLTAEVAGGVPTPTVTWYQCEDAEKNNPTELTTGATYNPLTTTVGTYYFYAVASNGISPDATSAVVTLTVKDPDTHVDGNSYYVAAGDPAVNGSKIYAENITAELIAGGNLTEGAAEGSLSALNSNYVAYITSGENTSNGWGPEFTATVNGTLAVGVKLGKGKTFTVSGVSDFDRQQVGEDAPTANGSNSFATSSDTDYFGIITIDVVAGTKYRFAVSASKMGFYGFEFTPVPATVPVEITHTSGYRTYASKYITDWSSAPAGITAYKAIVTGDDVTFEAVTGKAPAGTGLLIKADAKGTYDIPTETTADDVTSALVGVTAEKTIDGAGIFVLLDGTQGVGFYRTTAESFTVGANTAYLPASVSARSFIGFDDETTGILSVNNGQLTVDGFFDLQGRRMDQPTKGLYIVNGKKVIVK